MSTLTFAPPGPGVWELDRAHAQRPFTAFMAEVFPVEMPRGFAEATKRYGALLDRFDIATINGFMYMAPRPVGAPPGAKGPPPKPIFQLLTMLHPELRRRIKTSEQAFATRLWRQDLAEWDDRVKPATIALHLALQGEDPAAMDDATLAAYLGRCRDHVAAMIRQHHRYNLATLLPVGDYLAQASEWTGLPPKEVLKPLQGATPISVGAEAELTRLAHALGPDAVLQADGQAPADAVRALRDRPGEAGEAARAWLDRVENRLLTGVDLTDRTMGEVPEALLARLRAALAAPPDEAAARAAHDAASAKVRDRVPERHRAAFDEALGEARLLYRLRDERGMLSDMWAMGIMRRAILVAGARLAAADRLDRAELLLEATVGEMQALVHRTGGPGPDVLADRARHRETANMDDAPTHLGGTPGAPPPADWLRSPEARRMARAIDVVVRHMFQAEGGRDGDRAVKGAAAGEGVYEGPARLVLGPQDFGRLEQGDVMVAPSTTAAFNVVLPLLGGIVTDHGGLLCHTAIVAREYGIPAVIGTKDGTRVIPDGARVRVDAESGVVKVLG